MFDDQRGATFLQRLEDGVEVAGQFRSGNDFEHDAILDPHHAMVKPERVIIALVLCVTAACQSTPPPSSPKTRPSPSATPLAACPATPAQAGPQVLLQNLPAPDDLAFDPEGRLLFSDITAGSVSALNPDRSVERIAAGLSAPEGMVLTADGRILVAEQGR